MSHHPRVLIGYWVNELSPVKGQAGRHPDWIKAQWIKWTQGPRIRYHVLQCHRNLCRIMCLAKHMVVSIEWRVLETGSSEGKPQWQREGQQLFSTLLHTYCATCPNSVYWSWPSALLFVFVLPHLVAVRPWCCWAWLSTLWSHRAWYSRVYRP